MRLLIFIVIVTLITQIPPVKRFIADSLDQVRATFFNDLESRSRIQHKARRQQQIYRRQRSSGSDDSRRPRTHQSISQQLTDTRTRTIREMNPY